MSAIIGKRFDANDPSTYGTRPDGSQKGAGYFGLLKRPNGDISTELSIGVGIGGKEVDIPTLVPGLTKQEINYLLTTEPNPRGLPESIVRKAVDHAKMRMAMGKSPFAEPGEQVELPK